MITPTGDIKSMTVPRLIQELRAEKKTGTLVLSRDKETKKIYFRSGDIIYAASNQDADQLGASLISSSKITSEQHAVAVEAAGNTGKPVTAMLVERGFLSPKDLVDGAKEQVSRILSSVLSWIDGKYVVDNHPLPLGEIVSLQLSTGMLLVSGLAALDWKIIRKSLPPLKTIIAPAKDGSPYLQGIALEQDQQTVLALANGSRTIEEICALSEMGDFTTLKALYVLYALRLVDAGAVKTAEQARAEAAVAAGVQDGQDAEQTDDKVTKEMILHALESLALQDYYQMLDIGRGATAQEIKKAYFRYAKLYHPDRHMDSEMVELKVKLEELFMNITEAYNILSKEDTRKKYNLALASGVKRYRTADQLPSARQQTQKATAASQFNEGLKMFRVQNFWAAEEAFSWAARLDPSNPEYVFQRGLALARMPRRMHDAEDLFNLALKMAPSKVEYYLEIGNFYAKNGLKAKALALFKDALLRDPNSEKLKQAIKNVGGVGTAK